MELTSMIARASEGHDLTAEEAESAFHEIMSGRATPVQTSALLVALRTKGHAPSEVAGGVRALRRAMVPVETVPGTTVVDTCGTGGGSVTTFNISTAAALVAAAAGVPIAKHGNRSFTSKSGSADVLEALGVEIQLTPGAMARVLARVGIVFMFAPLLHPAMRHVGPVRRELAIPTIMNVLGPLTNPAGVRRQVVGVSQPELLPLLIRALEELGHERALVVHGAPGMDEISPLGPTRVAELGPEGVSEYEIHPEDFGLSVPDRGELVGGLPEENARVIQGVISGTDRGGARTVTLLNAAAALYVADAVDDLAEGLVRAGDVLDSGAARDTLESLRRESALAAADESKEG
ncbi:MAG: anthranilate phosphoribosyltransferase [Gemmatimonadota bacterium]